MDDKKFRDQYRQEILSKDPREEDLFRMWKKLDQSLQKSANYSANAATATLPRRYPASPYQGRTAQVEKSSRIKSRGRGHLIAAACLAILLLTGAVFFVIRNQNRMLVPMGSGDDQKTSLPIAGEAKTEEQEASESENLKEDNEFEENERLQAMFISTNQEYTPHAPLYPAEKSLKIQDLEIHEQINGMFWMLLGMPDPDHLILGLRETERAADPNLYAIGLYRISNGNFKTLREATAEAELRSKIYPQHDGKLLIVDFPHYPEPMAISVYDIKKNEETMLVSIENGMELYDTPILTDKELIYAPFVMDEAEMQPPILVMDLESKEVSRLPEFANSLFQPDGTHHLLKYKTDENPETPLFQLDLDGKILKWDEGSAPLHSFMDSRIVMGPEDVYDIHMHSDDMDQAVLYNKSKEKTLLEYGLSKEISGRGLFNLQANESFLAWSLDHYDWPKMVYDLKNDRFLLFEHWGEDGMTASGYQMTFLVPGGKTGVIASVSYDDTKDENSAYQGDLLLTQIGKTKLKIFEMETEDK